MATNEQKGDARKEYSGNVLSRRSISDDPFKQFEEWYHEAEEVEEQEVNAMSLSTVSIEGIPSSRIVLLKEYSSDGFVFYTNYESQKGRELLKSGKGCLLFWWPRLARQVRITGSVEKASIEAADRYFARRPRGSQIGAAASPQSATIESREALEERVRLVSEKYEGSDVPRPGHWGGYIVRPDRIEFWQGQLNRLHDRICFERVDESGWTISRLAP